MTERDYNIDIPIGSFWRDKDKRESSGNRIVRVIAVLPETVVYVNRHSDRLRNESKRSRFVKAFERVEIEQ